MKLTSLEIRHFRNLETQKFVPSPGINLIYGENGSGKSSLLEAIYFLGTGKSFRTQKSNNLIKNNNEQFTLFANLKNKEINEKIGIIRTSQQTKVKFNGSFISNASSLASILPIQIVEPNLHRILSNGPEYRRRFIEWGVFHVEPTYEQVRKIFLRNLLQRNAALKSRSSSLHIEEWSTSFAEISHNLHIIREQYFNKLFALLNEMQGFPDFVNNCSFEFYRGWPSGDLGEFLRKSQASDKERGYTQYGPQRADIKIKIGNQYAKDILSRGQQNLLISTLLILQVLLITREIKHDVIILIDDAISELDKKNQSLFINLLQMTNCQVFITSPIKEELLNACGEVPYRLFHVEHGHIRQMV